jgi:hypothetical protein
VTGLFKIEASGIRAIVFIFVFCHRRRGRSRGGSKFLACGVMDLTRSFEERPDRAAQACLSQDSQRIIVDQSFNSTIAN